MGTWGNSTIWAFGPGLICRVADTRRSQPATTRSDRRLSTPNEQKNSLRMSTLDSLGESLHCDQHVGNRSFYYTICTLYSATISPLLRAHRVLKAGEKRGARQPPLSNDAVIRHFEVWMPWSRRSGLALTHQKKCMATSDEIDRLRMRRGCGYRDLHAERPAEPFHSAGLNYIRITGLHRFYWGSFG